MLDVFFISMGEEGSEANWQRLLEFAPDAKRVVNVKGIYQVHEACAKQSTTENFWVVDADAWILDDFDFDIEFNSDKKYWNIPESECVLVWPSHNPVNNLEYGYGGIKLFPRQPFLENRKWEIDLSTTIGRAIVSQGTVGCETRFNATPESAWIGAFRECAKLSSLASIKSQVRQARLKQQQELDELNKYVTDLEPTARTNYRKSRSVIIRDRYRTGIDIFKHWDEITLCSNRKLVWCTRGWDKLNGNYVLHGARTGSKFGLEHSDDLKTLNLLNDWEWLKQGFKNVSI